MVPGSEKIWAFAVLSTKLPAGIGKVLMDSGGVNTTNFIQAMVDYGIHTKIVVKDNFGKTKFEWVIIFSKEINRKQLKQVIRQLLNEHPDCQNYEMFVISGHEEVLKDNHWSIQNIALDIDDSVQKGKFKVLEALKRWNLIESNNYRASPEVKYNEFRKEYRKLDDNGREINIFDNIKVILSAVCP